MTRNILYLAGTALLVLGCGIKQADLDQQIAAVRSDMQSADNQLGHRVDTVDTRSQQTARDVSNLEAEVRRLEQALEQLRANFDEAGLQMAVSIRFAVPVHFDYDSHELRERDLPLLDRFASVIHDYYPEALVTLEGFADPAGEDAYNLWLGEQRAAAVRTYLTQQAGMPSDRVRIVSYGEAANRQVEPGAWGPQGAVNRRVSMVVEYSAIQQALVN
jgi:peptidoglycan-associated lipoprotein